MAAVQPRIAVTKIGEVFVDASMRESHSTRAEITEHPIEDGADIADHCHIKPRIFQVEGIITNQPISLPQSQVDGVSEAQKEFTWEANPRILGMEMGGGGIIGTALGAIASAAGINQQSGTAKGYEPEFDRIIAARDEILTYIALRDPITIETKREIYENMLIESFDEDRDASIGDGMRFSLVAVQIRIVQTEYSVAPPIPNVQRGKPEKSRGKKTPQALDPNNASDAQAIDNANDQQSIASQLF